MPSIIGHTAVALAGTMAVPPKSRTPRVVALAILCSVLPDIDSVGFWYGVPYHHWLGHRGLFHGFVFAVAIGLCAASLAKVGKPQGTHWLNLAVLFALLGASHGLLDAATNGGLGIAFFWPFSDARFFLPWRPIAVAPLNPARMLSPWGMRVMVSELVWLVLPALLLGLALWTYRRMRTG